VTDRLIIAYGSGSCIKASSRTRPTATKMWRLLRGSTPGMRQVLHLPLVEDVDQSERESEIARLIARGGVPFEIGNDLDLSVRTSRTTSPASTAKSASTPANNSEPPSARGSQAWSKTTPDPYMRPLRGQRRHPTPRCPVVLRLPRPRHSTRR
jgi:hypothetical protein